MENKYYTPTIEEFRIGFEFQMKVYGEDDMWADCIYSKLDDSVFNVDSSGKVWIGDSIRVPYLTKEQIEKEGWDRHKNGNFYFSYFGLKSGDLLNLEIFESGDPTYKYFVGTIKNISDFRVLCKQLNITK